MANTFDAEIADQAGAPEAGGPPPGGPPPGGGASGPGGPPSGGGGVLAALMRQRQGPQQSAPGPGAQADALNKLSAAIELIQAALPGLGAGTPPHKDALKAVTALSRHLAQGSPTAGVQKTMFSDMLQGTVRNALLQKLQAGGQNQPGQQPPMPSQPQPGT